MTCVTNPVVEVFSVRNEIDREMVPTTIIQFLNQFLAQSLHF